MTLPPPSSTLFPYTTLFRSCSRGERADDCDVSLHPRPRAEPLSGAEGSHGEGVRGPAGLRSKEHTSELQSLTNLVCRLLLEKKKNKKRKYMKQRNSEELTDK